MKTRCALLITLMCLCVSNMTLAQPSDTYVSGLLHTPRGTAQLDTVDGRRVPVHNLGSSGEDGVEITGRSAWGVGAALEIADFLHATATLSTRWKGWDGTIKGRMDLASHGDGSSTCTCDFSGVGATSVLYQLLDSSGAVVHEGTFPPGGVDIMMPFVCPDGSLPIWQPVVHYTEFGNFYVKTELVCDSAWNDGPDTFDARVLILNPVLPGGVTLDGVDSELITASGISDLTVADAHLETFSVATWGLGQAHLAESCDDSAGCPTRDLRKLHADNLGSSGLDGVAIDLGPNAGGVSVFSHKPRCCRGHIIIMKLYDDEGQEQRIIRTQTTDPAGTEELDADFSSLGASGYRLTLFDASGGVLGPPEGTAILGGGPKPILTNRCPVGSQEIWQNTGTANNPVWVFQGCLDGIGAPYDFVIPGVAPVPNVYSFRIEPLDATHAVGHLTQCVITSDDPDGITLGGVTVTVSIKGDMDCDGALDMADLPLFIQAILDPTTLTSCALRNGDINGDSLINGLDIQGFVDALTGP